MIAVSFDEKLTLTNSQYCKDIIKSAEYKELFGDLFQIRKDIDSKERFANNKGGERLSVTTGANITGFGAEIIIVDDPQNPKTAESEVERGNCTKYYVESLYNRLTPLNLGVRIVVQQRLHHEDLTGYLVNNDADGYTHICLPAELSKEVKPIHLANNYRNGLLDPVRLSLIELSKLRKQGSRYYAGQYLQLPSPDEGGILKREWFDIIDAATLSREPFNEPIHFFVDSAFTDKQENDPTAILACYKKNFNIYIVDVIQVWKNFPDLIRFLTEYVNKFQISDNSKLFIEEAASGYDIVSQLRATTKLNVIGIAKPKDSKVTRAHSITAKLEAKRAVLVNGAYVKDTVDEWAAFPNGSHDDRVDTLIHAVTQLLIGEDTPDVIWI
jgi:predicted phage terminase large subunit-like protein